MAGRTVRRPSPDLLDTIYVCRERQDWYRDDARIAGEDDLGFVGSASIKSPPNTVAKRMRKSWG